MAQGELSDLSPPLRARLVAERLRDAALEHLLRDPLRNLLLIDLVEQVGRAVAPTELSPQILGAFEIVPSDDTRAREDENDGAVRGVAALRPSLVLEAGLDADALDVFLPYLQTVEAGLVKSARDVVDRLWRCLELRGRRASIDRTELAQVLRRSGGRLVDLPAGAIFRPAELPDLDALVLAARASLREESRPDPFDGDPVGFRRWVRGRLPRARVVEIDGRIGFVGYADVRRREGWLVQGVYTWPEMRRRGLAGAGMSGLVREAFAAGADHVQLAVVAGNEPALRLYGSLGFRPFDELRTILFT